MSGEDDLRARLTAPSEPTCAVCGSTDAECEVADGGCCSGCRASGGCSHDPTPAEPARESDGAGLRDREALAEVIAGIDGGRLADATTRAHDACLRAADAVLASDWLAARVAEAGARAVLDFVHWVAIARAHNGSEHQYGQSLYNECINAALPTWAADYLTARARGLGGAS